MDVIKEGTIAATKVASSGANSARDGAKYAGQQIYAGGAVAGAAVRAKLDETGVSDAAARGYASVVSNAKYAGSAVNEKIEANPTLAGLKRQTTAKMGAAAAFMGSLVGWGSGGGTGEEEKKQEANDDGDDSFEESKEEGEPQEEGTTTGD